MAIWKYEDKPQHVADQNYKTFMCDLDVDVKDLPKDVAPGSSCFVLESSAVYILSSDKLWIKI